MSGSKSFTTFGHVDQDGKLHLYNVDELWRTLESSFQRTSVEVRIRERFYPFTDQMRGYYFGVIVREIQKAWRAAGEIKSLEEVDHYMRDLYLYEEKLNPETDQWERERHTLRKGETKVSRKMMREFCELCIIWAVQVFDWPIPYPGEELSETEDPNISIKTNISI